MVDGTSFTKHGILILEVFLQYYKVSQKKPFFKQEIVNIDLIILRLILKCDSFTTMELI